MQWRNALVMQRAADWPGPAMGANFLHMRKLLDVERGDWQALVIHVRDLTKLKTGPLAARAGVSPETWWRWERRGQKPKEADVVGRFAKAFGLEIDDAMWAAGLLVEGQAEEADPRLLGLDPADEVVQFIMSLEVDDVQRERMLERRRLILAERARADIEEIRFWAEESTAPAEGDARAKGRAA